MKILSIIAQKPNSTGSGVYLTELVNCFNKLGHEQEVICAVYENDTAENNTNSLGASYASPRYNYIVFNTASLPIKIAGMSDVMPYESLRYSELAKDEKALKLWEVAFENKIIEVLNRFKSDLIIYHHLYLLTSIVVNICKDDCIIKVDTSSVGGRYHPPKCKGEPSNICHLSQY